MKFYDSFLKLLTALWNADWDVIYIYLLWMEETLHQLIGSFSHYFQGFIHPQWCRISSINSGSFPSNFFPAAGKGACCRLIRVFKGPGPERQENKRGFLNVKVNQPEIYHREKLRLPSNATFPRQEIQERKTN